MFITNKILRDKQGKFKKKIYQGFGFKKGNVPWNKSKKGVYSKGYRKKLSDTKKGRKRKPFTKETKEKMSKARKGIRYSEKTKKKMSIAKKGKPLSDEHKAKIKENNCRYWLGKKRLDMIGKNHFNWQGGKSFEPYTTDWTETLRRSIRERDRYTCQLCGKEPAICVHHIDYDKKNCNPNNLIILCRSCNSKVNKNRSYWINYFKIKINESIRKKE